MLSETLYVPTADGWRLAVHHWAAKGRPRRHPILMVHGLGANRLHLDLDERHSIARAARSRGFDVFVLELRGAGLSISPGGQDRATFQWGFGDYMQMDLPPVINTVLERTGASAVHGLGHSMGGMLFYAYGVKQPPELRSIITIGAPLVCDLNLGTRERRLLSIAARLAPQNRRRVPMRSFIGS